MAENLVTDTQTKYYNPRCAYAPRVKNVLVCHYSMSFSRTHSLKTQVIIKCYSSELPHYTVHVEFKYLLWVTRQIVIGLGVSVCSHLLLYHACIQSLSCLPFFLHIPLFRRIYDNLKCLSAYSHICPLKYNIYNGNSLPHYKWWHLSPWLSHILSVKSVSVLCCVASLPTVLMSRIGPLYDVCYYLLQNQMFVLSYVLQVM